MNTAEIIPLINDHPAVSEVDRLLAERAAVIAELARLATIDSPVREAEMAVQAVDRAVAALDEAERSRAEEWAKSGVGAPPEARNSERASLVRRRIELASDADAARNRANALTPRRNALASELRRIDHAIFGEKIKSAVEEARRLDAEAHELARQAQEPIGRVAALRVALMQHRSAVSDNPPAQRLIGEAIDALSRFAMPELGGLPENLGGFIADWEAKL